MEAGNSEVVAIILFFVFCIPFSYLMEIYFDSPARIISG